MACPEGKSSFNHPNQSSKYWENPANINNFLSKIKEKYNFNTPEDWNSVKRRYIQSNGGWGLLKKYSLYEINAWLVLKEDQCLTNLLNHLNIGKIKKIFTVFF